MTWFEQAGVSIYFEVTGEGEPVLLLPGFSDSISRHDRLRDAMSSKYRVVAADLPGSGRSPPQPRDYTPSYLQDDAHSFAALIETIVGKPVHLLGYSDGGEVALLMAALYPQRVTSVLAWGAVGSGSKSADEMIDGFFDVIDRPHPSWEPYREYLMSSYGEATARAMTQGFATNLRAIIDAGGDISRSKASTIECPVMLVVGEHDTANPIEVAEQYAHATKAGRAIQVSGAGHDVHSSHPDWFETTAMEWLAAHSTAK